MNKTAPLSINAGLPFWGAAMALVVALLALVGCGGDASDSTQEAVVAKQAAPKPLVLTTTLPLYDFTRKLAGGDFDVALLPPPAVGPHNYSASFKDRERMLAAALVVSNGLALEAWFDESLTKQLEERGVKVLRTGDRIPKQMLRPNGDPKWGQDSPGLIARLGAVDGKVDAEGTAEPPSKQVSSAAPKPTGAAERPTVAGPRGIAPIAKAGGKPATVVAPEPVKAASEEGLESILISHVHGPG